MCSNNSLTLSDFLSFFSLRREDTNRWSVLSSMSISGLDLDMVTSAVKSTGRERSAASSCHFAVSFTDLDISRGTCKFTSTWDKSFSLTYWRLQKAVTLYSGANKLTDSLLVNSFDRKRNVPYFKTTVRK